MPNPTDQLADLLSQHMLGHPYDPDSLHDEKFVIDHLIEEVMAYEGGMNTYQELKAIFSQHNTGTFDLDQWLQVQVDAGVYWPIDTSQ